MGAAGQTAAPGLPGARVSAVRVAQLDRCQSRVSSGCRKSDWITLDRAPTWEAWLQGLEFF